MRKWRSRERYLFVTIVEAVIASASLLAAFLLRFEYAIPKSEVELLTKGLPLAVLCKTVAFHMTGLHRVGWRYVGIRDLRRMLAGNLLGSLLFAAAAYAVVGPAFPRSVYGIDFLISLLLVSGARISVRLYFESVIHDLYTGTKKRILVYGAGAAGAALTREIQSNPSLHYQVVGFLDDSTKKYGQNIMGATVLGRGRDAPMIADRLKKRRKVDEIVIAMPSATGQQMREALANCRAAGLPCKTIPGVKELLSGRVLASQIREVCVEDLLGREPVTLQENQIRSSIEGRTVLVTGGGGSIGSELCRQVASFHPEKLIIFERAESDLYRIHLELSQQYPGVEVLPQIGDIREYPRVEQVIRRHAVQSVFHAAAYKHVPMMESHLLEAVHNNILGTRNMVNASFYNGVSDFLMISSDKAVNPTNIMGLTKRVAEIIVSAMPVPSEGSRTKFVSVRFGNVLGSNGSVVPLFRQQIAAGGPVTVTHPEMKRYFMTIREAVQLVLQASTMGNGSEIFVLDMGEPVRIVDLARNMIRLSGHEPDVEIEIRYVGVRPGEKLFEELIASSENIVPTHHEKIRIFQGTRKSYSEMERWLKQLEALATAEDRAGLLKHLRNLVPEYLPAEQWRDGLKIATA